MFGLGTKNRVSGGRGRTALAEAVLPDGAGLFSCRVLDPVGEPLAGAECSLTDGRGRKVATAAADPFGSFVVSVAEGEYRLAVGSEGYTPHRGDVLVRDGEHTDLGALTLQAAAPPALPSPGDWEIDPTHSSIAFTARHIGLARVHGRFNTFAGVVRIGERVEDFAMHVLIDAASIDTNVRMRDDHLRSSDFLDVSAYPTLEFYSERFAHRGGGRWGVTGALSLHGVTRTVTLDVDYLGQGNGMEGEQRAACRATTELHRDDYTVSWQTMLARGIAVVGPSITIELDVQVIPKQG
ncbi:YceI family protein [Streptomyces sp. NPDC047046]|uniref:YceI family protein n=1 Tax=unclassified Streptomyces TaxID=2593676 RepID=UPI00340DE7B4